MAKFNFNLRNPQTDKYKKIQEKTPVNFLIRWDGNKLVYPTGLTIHPGDWEGDKTKGKRFQRAKPTLKEHAEFNASLTRLESIADKTFLSLVNNKNRQPTVDELREALKKALNSKGQGKMNFFAYFEKFIRESEFKTNSKTQKPYSPSTIGIYKTALNHLRDFAKTKKKRIDFDTIDLDFYYSYSEYLEKVKRFGLNNKGKQFKVIKSVLNEATEGGYNKNLAFRSKRFKVVSEEAENIYLTDEELQELYNLDLSDNKKLERVRDLFYIGCNTGLRFSDLSRISKDNITGNKLKVKTKKTGNPVTIPLKTEVFEIMNRYEGKFPHALSNQKMNEYLKEVCQLVGSLKKKTEINKVIDGMQVSIKTEKYKLVSTHTARRSYATNCYKKQVPVFIIMNITGHRTEKSFLKYIKMTTDEHADIMEMYLTKNQLKVI